MLGIYNTKFLGMKTRTNKEAKTYYEEILEKLETLPSSSQVDSIINKLDEISDHIYTLLALH